MRLRYFLMILAFAVGMDAAGGRAQVNSSSDVLAHTQAAEVMADLLTYGVDRTDARVTAMRRYLRETGREAAYDSAAPAAPKRSRPLYYSDVFRGAVAFVKSGGSKYADPTLLNLSDPQLLERMTSLQAYNLELFLKLTKQREAADSMAMYLEASGQFGEYVKWARATYPPMVVAASGLTSTRPSAVTGDATSDTPEAVAARMRSAVDTAKALAWDRARADGVAQDVFEQQWAATVRAYSEYVVRRAEGSKALAAALSQADEGGGPIAVQPAQPPPPVATPNLAASAGRSLPPPVASPYTSSYYQSVDGSIWNDWNDGYSDVTYEYRRR